MKQKILNDLVCPCCGGSLKSESKVQEDDEILEGKLICKSCNECYEIKKGIPVFLSNKLGYQDANTTEGWYEEWRRWGNTKIHNINDEYQRNSWNEQYLTEWLACGIERAWFKGKKILVPGCGAGVYNPYLLELGGEIYAFDITDAVYVANEQEHNKRIHFFKADAARLPFNDNTFDFIVATGMLQHTENPPVTIKELATKLKPNGYFFGSLYVASVKHPNNPPLMIRGKIKLIQGLRKFLSFFPSKLRYYFTWFSIPCCKFRVLRPIRKIFFLYDKNDQRDENIWLLNYDCYIPGYHHTYTLNEQKRFYKSAGLEVILESKWPGNHICIKRKI